LAAVDEGIPIGTCINKGLNFGGKSIKVHNATKNKGGSAKAASKIKLLHHVRKFKVSIVWTWCGNFYQAYLFFGCSDTSSAPGSGVSSVMAVSERLAAKWASFLHLKHLSSFVSWRA
jgi:hypothetical protein